MTPSPACRGECHSLELKCAGLTLFLTASNGDGTVGAASTPHRYRHPSNNRNRLRAGIQISMVAGSNRPKADNARSRTLLHSLGYRSHMKAELMQACYIEHYGDAGVVVIGEQPEPKPANGVWPRAADQHMCTNVGLRCIAVRYVSCDKD